MKNNNQNSIHSKLKSYIRLYYKRDLYEGLIITLSGLTALFFLFSLAEYIFRFNGWLRAFLFFSFLGILTFAFFRNIVLPFARMNNWTKGISKNEAASKIGSYFPEIEDKLINILQLENHAASDLITASVHQKSKAIASFEFKEAVSFKNLTKLAKWGILPFLLVAVLASFQPQVLSSSASRIVKYNQEFAPENPFDFKITNDNLSAFRNQNITIELEFDGDQIPKDVYIEVNNLAYRLQKTSGNQYKYEFRNIQKGFPFKIKMDEFYSKNYNVDLIEKPVLAFIQTQAVYPPYVHKKNETFSSVTDLVIPEGTVLKWDVQTQESDSLVIGFGDTSSVLTVVDNKVHFERRLLKSAKYTLLPINKRVKNQAPLSYSITVLKDQIPQISVQHFEDSLNPLMLYHSGVIKDDYGIKKLLFNFSTKDTSGKVLIPIQKNSLEQSFNHAIHLKDLQLKKGEELSYYFEVFDNDAVNGSKSAKSSTRFYSIPTEQEISNKLDQSSEELKEQLNANLEKAQELQKEFDEIKKMMLEKPQMDWSDKSKIEQFLEKQKSFENEIEKLNEKNQENNFQKEQLSPQEEKILQKQEELNKLFEELMDEETKKLFEELEKLMEEFNQEDVKDVMEQIDLSNEELEKELDRTIELYKQMEFEQKLEKSIEKLEKLSEKQEKLSKETKENKDQTKEELEQKQDELNEEFKEVQKDLEDLKKKNEELENKKSLDEMKEEQNEVQEKQEESKEEISKGKNSKASKSQKQAAEKMKQMAEKMKSMQQQEQQQQQSEDINSLRQILENLISLSVEQEQLMDDFKQISRFDPSFTQLSKKQAELKEGAKIIEDSLLALSKRQISLESIINKEILDINFNMEKSINYLSDRNQSQAQVNQQLIMTSANNLALILDESLQQMQNQMMSMQPGSGSCSKPGGSQPKDMQSLKKMQQALNKQLQEMKKEMEEGNQKGKKGKKGNKGMAKGLAQMAAEQSAIKEQLRKINENQKKQGKGGLGELESLQEEMDKTERDILNKNITKETLERQQQIMSKLLEAENALREREFEEKRESKSGKNNFKRNPSDFLPYKSFELNEKEQLKMVPPAFNLYYKRKINEYFNTFGE